MDLATAELPDDVEALRVLVRAQAQETARLRAERVQIEQERAAGAIERGRLEAEVARLEMLVSRWEHLAGQRWLRSRPSRRRLIRT